MKRFLSQTRLPNWLRYGLRFLVAGVGLFLLLAFISRGLRRNVVDADEATPIDPATASEYASMRNPVLNYENPPEIWVDVDYTEGENATWWPKGESPILAKLVDQGELPPVEKRTGPEPAVYRGFAGIGRYGGDWWRLTEDIDGVRLALQYELKNNQLVRFSPYGEPIRPHLAKKVESNEDYTVWTVHLRRGVKWSDGVPFTAEDIFWWWQHVKQNEDVGFIDETMKVGGVAGNIEKVDDYTLRYTFPNPNPGWLRKQADAAAALYMAGPKHYMKQFHPTLGDQALIATLCDAEMVTPKTLFQNRNHPLNPDRPKLGPWLFRTYTSNGPWTAVRNPYYFAVDEHGNQLPYIDRLVFRQVSSELQGKAVTDGLASFEIDRNSDYASLMSGRESGHYSVRHWLPSARGAITVIPNRQKATFAKDPIEKAKGKLLQKARFRRALSIAINRQAIIDAELKGVGAPTQLGPGPSMPWYDPEHGKANAEYAPDEARRILDSLGLTLRDSDGFRTLPDGSRLTFIMIARPGETDPFLFMVQDWAAIGLRMILQEKPHRLFLKSAKYADLETQITGGSPETSWESLGAGEPYWDWYFAGGLHGTEASKALGTPQPGGIELKAMRLGQTAENTRDPEVRFHAAREVMRIAREQVWTINVATPQPEVVIVKDGLRGVPENLVGSFQLCSPNNACPECWYWENPDTINGENPASATYLAEREAGIIDELRHSTPKASRGREAVAAQQGLNAAEAPAMLGRLMKLLFIGIAVAVAGLLCIRHPFVLRRLVIMIPTLTVISILVYTGVQLPKGSYLDTVIANLEESGQRAQAKQELEELREMYHLEDGPVKNYFRWTGLLWFATYKEADKGILQGNLGRSMSNDGAFVTDLVGDRFLLTVCISLGSLIVVWLVAIPVGVYSAVRQYSVVDYVLTVCGFLGMCIPNFVLALILMLIGKELFGVTVMGLFSPRYAMQEYWSMGKVIDLLKHLWLPLVVISAAGTAGMIRVMRANLLDELKKPYVVTARAKGVRPLKLLFKYPFRLALNPFIAGIGGIFPRLIGGGGIVAIILSLPTVGPLLLNAVRLEDTYMAGSLLMLVSTLSVFGVLVSDLLLMMVDPRIRMEGGSK